MSPIDEITAALRYPWDDGDAGVTIVVGGILTLLSPLIVPAVLVLGYGLRVVEAVLDGEPSPPSFADPGDLFVRGLKGAVVAVAYVVVPLAVGAAILTAAAGAFGVRFPGGLPTAGGAVAAGGIVLIAAFLLVGLALLVAYLAPAALVHLARTRRLGAAFAVDDVRGLATADAYAASWLLAAAVFALAGVVLAVLNAAAVGVIVSGFVTFYALVAMASLYAGAAREAGFGLDLEAAEEAGADEE